MSLWLELLLIVVLAVANGVFSAAEIAVISVRKSRLKELVTDGNRAAASVARLRREPERFLATVQIGITLIGATAAAFGGASLSTRLTPVLGGLGFGRYAEDVALTAVILFVSYLSLVLGELVPKSLALRGAERYSLLVARPLLVLASIARPLVWFLTASSNVVLRLFGDRTSFTEARLSPEELQQLVEEAADDGTIQAHAGEIASRALDFGRLRVGAVMLPRASFKSIAVTVKGSDVHRIVAETTHDRLPVHDAASDDIVGYVTVRDLFLLSATPERTVKEVVRAPHFVPETVLASDVLQEMQRLRVQLALIVDEQGTVVGVVSLEDLVEELVGEIFAEHQKPTVGISRQADGSALVEGTVPVHEVNRELGIELPQGAAWVTIAGLVIHELGELPAPGARVTVSGGIVIEVVDATRRRVQRVRVVLPKVAAEAAP